jgi:hypothetical protein
LTLLLSGTAGWAAVRTWAGAPGDPTRNEPLIWAVVVNARPHGQSGFRTLADIAVRVTNVSREQVTLTGAETTFDAGGVESVTPDSHPIPAGTSTDAVAHAAVECDSTKPLRLYPLQFRHTDHTLATVQVLGAAAALTDICQAQEPQSRVLTFDQAQSDGERLRFLLRSPTGRATKVLGLRAAGVTLTGHPLGSAVDKSGHPLWINPPRVCPVQWLRAGIPRLITLDVDAGGPATVEVDTGYEFARWLRAGACAGNLP